MKSDRLFVLTFSIGRAYRYIDVLGDSKDARHVPARYFIWYCGIWYPKIPRFDLHFLPARSQGATEHSCCMAAGTSLFEGRDMEEMQVLWKETAKSEDLVGQEHILHILALSLDGSPWWLSSHRIRCFPSSTPSRWFSGPQAEHLGRCQWPVRHLAESSG